MSQPLLNIGQHITLVHGNQERNGGAYSSRVSHVVYQGNSDGPRNRLHA